MCELLAAKKPPSYFVVIIMTDCDCEFSFTNAILSSSALMAADNLLCLSVRFFLVTFILMLYTRTFICLYVQ